MGNQQASATTTTSTGTSPVTTTTNTEQSSRCPVKSSRSAQSLETSGAPESSIRTLPVSSASKCPVKHDDPTATTFNVYSQPIDPTNQMPVNPNQFPHQSQTVPLNTARVKSTIPKGGGSEKETWTYPSEQMFFNALKRKGKGSDASEDDMHTIIAIHNNMNERTWNRLLEFEKTFHCAECPTPKLHKFIGRPHDLSMKARLKTWMGWPVPFDRHDWTVDRCGTPVRYIIDYFHDEDEENDIKPHLRSRTDVKSITVDVRPAAFDSLTNLADAIRMPFYETFGMVADVYEDDDTNDDPTSSTAAHGNVDDEGGDSGVVEPKLGSDEVFKTIQHFREQCQTTATALKHCDGEEDCARKTMALDVCFGQIICPTQAAAFATDPDEDTYEGLTECISKFRAYSTKH